MKPTTRARIEITAAIGILVIGIVCFAVFLFPDRPSLGFSASIVILNLHLPQVLRAESGAGKNIIPARTVFMTTIFGASWWRNVEKGALER